MAKKKRGNNNKAYIGASRRTSYFVGLDGRAVKADGQSQLYNAFMGIHSGNDIDFDSSPEGLKNAYLKSALIMRCVRIRAHTLASIPRKIVSLDNTPVGERHPLELLIGQRHNRLFRTTESDMCIFGNAYWLPVQVTPNLWQMKRLNPMTIEVQRDAEGIYGYCQYIDGKKIAEWEAEQIIQFSDYDPQDDLMGVSLTHWALKTASVDLSLEEFAKVYFENDATPAGILTTDAMVNPADKERLKAEWKKEFRGTKNQFKVALLENKVEYQTITPALKDLAMRDLDEKSMRRIALTFGVPMTIVGMTEASNYATISQQHRILYTEAVIPEMELILGSINEHPFVKRMGVIVEPETDQIEALQEDSVQVTERSTKAFVGGVRSFNEARKLENLEPVEHDFFILPNMGAVSRADVEAGKLPSPTPPAQGFPFGLLGQGPSQAPPLAAPGKADVVIDARPSALDHVRSATRAYERDLVAWKRKINNRGLERSLSFEPDFLPSAYADFIRMDLEAGHDPIRLLDEVVQALKAIDETLPTPEEFEAYWQGIGELYDGLANGMQAAWDGMIGRIVDAIRRGGIATNLEPLLQQLDALQQQTLQNEFTKIFLAGAARGNDLLSNAHASANPAKAMGITGTAWDIINTDAASWARQYAAQQARLIGGTTRDVLHEEIAKWIENGGSLDDLANVIEGKVDFNDMAFPVDVNPAKIQWLTSADRARLIAQTETTGAYFQGVSARWKQAGVSEFMFRTQNDRIVCPICGRLKNRVGNLDQGIYDTETGQYYKPPVHLGCRCFPAPKI